MGTIRLNREAARRGVFVFLKRARRRALVSAALAPAIWLVASCDSETTGASSGGGSATPTEMQRLCDAQCARRARCNPQASSDGGTAPCSSSCVQDFGHLAETIRGDVARALADCYDGLACGVNDDICTTQAIVAIGISPDAAIHSQDVQKCLGKREACASMSSSFSDDVCGTMLLLIPSKRADLARCFEGPCELVKTCMDPIVGG